MANVWRNSLAVVLAVMLLGGCAKVQSGSTTVPQAVLQDESAPVVPSQSPAIDSQQPAETNQSQAKEPQKPADVRLVAFDPRANLHMTLLHPEGWSEFATEFQDGVQSQGPDGQVIHVMTRQLRGQKPPLTVDEMVSYIAGEAPGASVRQLQIDGTVSAFEVRYTTAGSKGEESVLDFYMFGKTYKQILSFSAPTPIFADWEPVFRKIQAAFEHSNLNAIPLPGRP